MVFMRFQELGSFPFIFPVTKLEPSDDYDPRCVVIQSGTFIHPALGQGGEKDALLWKGHIQHKEERKRECVYLQMLDCVSQPGIINRFTPNIACTGHEFHGRGNPSTFVGITERQRICGTLNCCTILWTSDRRSSCQLHECYKGLNLWGLGERGLEGIARLSSEVRRDVLFGRSNSGLLRERFSFDEKGFRRRGWELEGFREGGRMGQNAELGVPGPKISPSMLSSDFANLASEAKYMEECGADWLHMDIMDGHFVPNLTIGAPVIKSLRKHTKMFLDCHLMVTNPMDYVDDFVKAGASSFTFHIEAAQDNWQDLVHKIKAGGMRAGVSLRPGTPIEDVFPLVESEEPIDMVLVMTVEPGFGGQGFMPDMMPKVNTLRRKFPHLDIEVDGGLAPSTIQQAAAAGANCVVAGSSVFGSKDPAGVISTLRKGVEEAQAALVFFK